MNKTFLSSILSIVVIFCSITTSLSQDKTDDGSLSLSEKFLELKKKSETFNEYKVIKSEELNRFWKGVEDTLVLQRTKITTSNQLLKTEKEKSSELESNLAQTKSELMESQQSGNHMSLLGINLTKSSYAIILWIIVASLSVLIALLFARLKQSISIERKTKSEFEEVNDQLRFSKVAGLDREMKLKRELQTAINSLNELKGKSGSRF